MKNVLRASIVPIVGFALIGMLLLAWNHANAHPSSLAFQTSAVATTTVTYLTPGVATSTYQFDSSTFSSGKAPNMQQVDSISLYFQYAASSTSAGLNVTPQWSNNGIDWYGYNAGIGTPGNPGIQTLASTTLSYQFWPTGTATSSQVINLPAVWGQHERVIFSVQGANGAIYDETVLKSNPSNP